MSKFSKVRRAAKRIDGTLPKRLSRKARGLRSLAGKFSTGRTGR